MKGGEGKVGEGSSAAGPQPCHSCPSPSHLPEEIGSGVPTEAEWFKVHANVK